MNFITDFQLLKLLMITQIMNIRNDTFTQAIYNQHLAQDIDISAGDTRCRAVA
ncbi:hypothetical protein [Serratia fonticola]